MTFNNDFMYKDIPASYMEVATTVHNLLSILSHKCIFLADIQYQFSAVQIYQDNCHYLVFYKPRIGQESLIYMPKRARILSFTFVDHINFFWSLFCQLNWNLFYFIKKLLRIFFYLHLVWIISLYLSIFIKRNTFFYIIVFFTYGLF